MCPNSALELLGHFIFTQNLLVNKQVAFSLIILVLNRVPSHETNEGIMA
jgi:hypothetical protein